MKRKFIVFSAVFLCSVVLVSTVTPAITMSESISTKVFRLHILANSDSEADQSLKMKIKDKIISFSSGLYNNCENVQDAIKVSQDNVYNFKQTAQKVIAFYGYDYDTKVYVTKDYFPTRKYDNFTLPAGEYDCLKIIIGEGKGHNWWCVMFPEVCVSAYSEESDRFEGYLTEEEIKMIQSKGYAVRFKAVEIYEKIKNKTK
ncbi:MAG: stage II sporulation protein R [Eubacterium sp.]